MRPLGGLDALAAALAPSVVWTGLTLDIPDSGITGTHTSVVRLDGRGLTVVPSLFALRPMAFVPAEPTQPVLLILPCASSALPLWTERVDIAAPDAVGCD